MEGRRQAVGSSREVGKKERKEKKEHFLLTAFPTSQMALACSSEPQRPLSPTSDLGDTFPHLRLCFLSVNGGIALDGL